MLDIRLIEGLVLAVLLPLCFSRIRGSDLRAAALAGAYSAYTVLPIYARWQAWVAVCMSVVCAPAVRRLLVSRGSPAAPEHQESAEEARKRRAGAARAAARGARGAVFALPAGFAALTLGATPLWRSLGRALENDRLAVTVNGAAAALFLGGLATGLVLRRFSSVTAGRAQAVLGAGTLLGWLERTLYFAFLLAGQPTAAAFALTAKSAARFPALQRDEEGLAEYYLIGSLSSLVIAVVSALLTRLALGMAAV
jgi:hypothetical protein